MQKIRKNQWAVSEIFEDGHTHTYGQGWLLRTPPGKPKSNMVYANMILKSNQNSKEPLISWKTLKKTDDTFLDSKQNFWHTGFMNEISK